MKCFHCGKDIAIDAKRCKAYHLEKTDCKFPNEIAPLTPHCAICGKKMVNAVDSITGKLSSYIWMCEDHPTCRLNIG